MRKYTLVLGFIMMIGGLLWMSVLEIMRWDIPMTKLGHFVYLFYPWLLTVIGFFAVMTNKN